ncbi:MAG: sigma-70 family RNA polymerase sigma factor [Thermomonas sp.]
MSASMLQDRDELAIQVDGWLTAAGRGDQRAFDSLYQATSGMLLGVCMRVLNDRGEAEDVLQEVYVTIWRKAMQFDSARARASTWMGTIARNRCIDRLRSQPAPALRAPIEMIDFAEDPSPSPAAHAESSMERAQLDECIDQLEPKRQLLIRTAFFDGATYEELSTRSGSPLGSIKSWIRRGLLQLRACLES